MKPLLAFLFWIGYNGSVIEFNSTGAVDPIGFYSVADVAELTRLAPRTIYRAIEDGELQACRLRRQLRIPADAIRAWTTASIVAPKAPKHTASPRPGRVSPRRSQGRLRPLLEGQ